MTPTPPRNNILWRMSRVEEDIKELKQGQPAVMIERWKHLSEDMIELRNDVRSLRRAFVGFLISFTFFGITIVVAVVSVIGVGGG